MEYIRNGEEELVPYNVPQPDYGAPNPVIVESEHKTILAYVCDDDQSFGSVQDPVMVGPDTDQQTVCVMELNLKHRIWANTRGPIHAHPTFPEEMHDGPGVYEVRNSQLARDLLSNSATAQDWLHLNFYFHDTVLDLLCKIVDVKVAEGSVLGCVGESL
ncbi:hypothetical protein OAU50_05070 [Planctomycetota bacterium]|nr:hypothetical protein [Planctomycetota bacterium]